MEKGMNKNLWNTENIKKLFELSFFDLIYIAHEKNKKSFDPTEIEYCALLSIKTGSCPEDCAYCPQSAHYNTQLKKEALLDIDTIVSQAKLAAKNGVKRFCMGAAWRSPPEKEFPKILNIIQAVKELGLETCMTLGMLNEKKAFQLKDAGLDFYNHNLDTSPIFYKTIITTRTYQDRLETINHLASADINICCGGILGMGESREDRIQFLLALSLLPQYPKSIPINQLIRIPGTPLAQAKKIDHFEFIRTVAVTRLMFPFSMIRLSAGREQMSEEMQAWCFMAGANSIFLGDVLFTAKNPSLEKDMAMLKKLDIKLPKNEYKASMPN